MKVAYLHQLLLRDERNTDGQTDMFTPQGNLCFIDILNHLLLETKIRYWTNQDIGCISFSML